MNAQPPTPALDVLTLAPSPNRLVRTLGRGLIPSLGLILLVVAQFYRVRHNPTGQAVTLGTLVAVVGVVLGRYLLYFANVRIVVGPSFVEFTNSWRAHRRFARSEIKGLAICAVRTTGIGPPLRFAIMFGPGHRSLIRLSTAFWDEADLDNLHSKLGGPRQQLTTTMPLMARDYPGSLRFHERHPWLVVISVAIVVLAIIFALPPSG